jgi:hypothetical protein
MLVSLYLHGIFEVSCIHAIYNTVTDETVSMNEKEVARAIHLPAGQPSQKGAAVSRESRDTISIFIILILPGFPYDKESKNRYGVP